MLKFITLCLLLFYYNFCKFATSFSTFQSLLTGNDIVVSTSPHCHYQFYILFPPPLRPSSETHAEQYAQ